MLNTYKATLRGNRLEWSGDIPKRLPSNKAVAVHVTILDESVEETTSVSRGQRMAAALEQLAAAGALPELTDPVTWEREIRQDRVLPGRES